MADHPRRSAGGLLPTTTREAAKGPGRGRGRPPGRPPALPLLLLALVALALGWNRWPAAPAGSRREVPTTVTAAEAAPGGSGKVESGAGTPSGTGPATATAAAAAGRRPYDDALGRCPGGQARCWRDCTIDGVPVWAGERDGRRGVLDIEGPSGVRDAGFACRAMPMNLAADHWITGFAPLYDRERDLVHHMDIFLCDREVERYHRLDDPEVCSQDKFMPQDAPDGLSGAAMLVYGMLNPQAPAARAHSCHQVALVFDKDAEAYHIPAGKGIKVGPNTAESHVVVIQNHYLVPPGFDHDAGLLDSSGMRVFLTTEPPGEDVGLFALNDFSLAVPPRRPRHRHTYTMAADRLAAVLAAEFATVGEVRLVAAHLHMHGAGREIWVDHLRGAEKLGEYGRKMAYTGYGPDQTFFDLPPADAARPFRPGDTLRLTCVFENAGETTIKYGVSHGTEMCAAIFLYAPHLPGSEHPRNNMVSTYSVQGSAGAGTGATAGGGNGTVGGS